MPDGVIQWVDERMGLARVARRGRSFVVKLADMAPDAKVLGGRVRYEVVTDGGRSRATAIVRARARSDSASNGHDDAGDDREADHGADGDMLTLNEAIEAMAAERVDWYLFNDLATGEDALLVREPDGRLQLQFVSIPPPLEGLHVPVRTRDGGALRLTAADAADLLCRQGLRILFFVDDANGRGAAAVARADGTVELIRLPAGEKVVSAVGGAG